MSRQPGTVGERVRLGVLATLVVALGAADLVAQTKFDRDQSLQPVFEGWERNADGSFNLVFGYLNRNYEERLNLPVGADNAFSPGEPDRGQPTFFYPRRQNFVFKVRVPADFGDRDLIWTVTRHGRADTAVGSLWPVWEIDEGVVRANRGVGISGAYIDNTRPSIGVVGDTNVTVTLPDTLTLAITAADDGNPGPNPEAADRRGDRRGRPGPDSQNILNPWQALETGLAVTWLLHRGPAPVTFAPMVQPVSSGEATTVATFRKPGTYVLRAVADDTVLTANADITVTVRAPASP